MTLPQTNEKIHKQDETSPGAPAQRISVVIPCYNEAQALPAILSAIPKSISEVIVVDNGSTDDSGQIAQKFFARVVHENIKGYGSAILTGIQHASGDIIALFDGDGTYPIEDFMKALIFMRDHDLDFLSGCRFPLSDETKAMPIVNQWANHGISWLTAILFRIHLKDSQSGLMIFKKRLFDKIHVNNKGMGFSQELKIKAWLVNNARCSEMHIHYNSRIGESKFRKIPDGLKNLFAVFKLYFDMKMNKKH